MDYLTRTASAPTPQREAQDERQTPNSAGGYVFPVDDLTRLHRFLVLGSENGSYYSSERALTMENTGGVRRLLQTGGLSAVSAITQVSRSRRAPRNDEALFCLAIAASHGDPQAQDAAMESLPLVARTGSHLCQFVDYVSAMRGWGRKLRKGVARWYMDKTVEQVVHQTVKYRQRNGWTHGDILRKCHAAPDPGDTARRQVFQWLAHGDMPEENEATRLIHAFEKAKNADADELASLIREHEMTWEMVPTGMRGKKEIWDALLERMPVTALVRNLANMTRAGAVAPMNFRRAVDVIQTIGADGTERIHPVSVLWALMTYRAGRSARSDRRWDPVSQVTGALDAAFERSFINAPRTDRRFYLAVDISGSMSRYTIAGVPGLTPRMGAAAMAMAIARREPNHHILGFASRTARSTREPLGAVMAGLDITAGDSLTDAMDKTQRMPFGGTDCALPMPHALENGIPVDCFVILTDHETWAGDVHPAEALRRYRRETGIPAKLAVVAMVSNGFSLADPGDAGMMDFVGFDAAVPSLIADFAEQGLPMRGQPREEPAETE